MKWRRGTVQGQVEDYRGRGGGMGGFQLPLGKAGGGGLGLILLLVIYLLAGGLPGGGSSGLPIDLPAAGAPASGGEAPPASDDEAQFVQFVVADVQATWKRIFAEGGQTYQPTTLRLFTSGIQTGCGAASAGGRAVLLPGRPPCLHRPRLLPRAPDPLPGAPATSPRPT